MTNPPAARARFCSALQLRDLGDLRADRLAQRGGVLGEVDLHLAGDAVQRERGHRLGPLGGRAEQGAQGERAAVVEVDVVLVGVADAAEDLDGVLGALHGGVRRDHTRDRRGVVQLPALGAGRVPDRRAGLLQRHEHARRLVLDALELADRAAELHAHLGVLGGGGHAPGRDARGLGAQQDRGQVQHGRALQPVQDPPGRHGRPVELDLGRAPSEVQRLDRRHGRGGGVHRHPLLAPVGADREHQDVGERAAQHGLGATADRQGAVLAAGAGDRAGERDGAGQRAVGETGQQLGVGLAVGGEDRGAGEHRRDVGAGGDALAEGLDGHGGLQQAVPAAAVLLRNVQPEQALVGQAGPEAGALFPLGRDDGPYDLGRNVALGPAAHRLAERLVLLAQPDRHVSLQKRFSDRTIF
nr:hypothetical protein GCM10020093_094300 [Planobispora longispora]